MTAFTLIPGGWIDPFELICSLRPRMGWFKTDDIPAHRLLRVTPKVIEKWPELSNMLTAIEALGEGQYERGETLIQMVDAGGSVGFATGLRGQGGVLMALRINDATTVHGPGQIITPQPGYLFAVADVPVCVMNMGASPWIGLLIEARRTGQ